jgi:predicted TIM-barrel enzyme
MAEAGADVIIAHVGCTVGGSIGVTDAAMSLEGAAAATQAIIEAGKTVRDDVIYLSHGGPIATPADAAFINERTDASGFVGASSLERMAVEESLTNLTKEFKSIPLNRKS